MAKVRDFIDKLNKFQKITCLILLLSLVLLLSIGIPTLAIYRNKSASITASVWNGSVASGYRKGNGTEANPYIISNGSELAYFETQLSNNDYTDKYVELSNDIVLNDGIFSYDSDNGIEYTLNNQTYYVDPYSNKYYDNVNMSGAEIGTINIFKSLDNFKGHFDGNSFTISGLYVTDDKSDELALFTNLQGSIKDLYVENSLVYGGMITAGIASTASNASISDVLFDGNVIGRSTEITKSISTKPTSSVINLQNTETTNHIDLTNNIPFVGSEIISTSITGNYTINGSTNDETVVKINGVTVTNGSFDINLGDSILNDIQVVTSTTSEVNATLTFSDLSYNITYKYGVAGGIVGESNHTTIENTINKASIFGYSVSGGLVGVATDLVNVKQSYNTGSVGSNYSSGGLIGVIEKSNDDISLSNDYNTGNMSAPNIGGLVGVINDNEGSVSISNVFNTSTTDYSIGTINNTDVNVNNAYFVNGINAIHNGVVNGDFTSTTLDNLKTKSYAVNNLSFDEFIGATDIETNNQNVWVYEDDSLPVLFIDSVISPIANINVSVHSWDDLRYELNTVKLNSNITFSIEAADSLKPLKEIYYYISDSNDSLTEQEISQVDLWNPYSDVVQITTEGSYVIYAKVVDYNNNVTYLNTDVLVLDLSSPSATISVDNSTWSNLRSNLNYLYIDRPKKVTVEANDNQSGISSVKYYITNQILDVNDLNGLNDNNWNDYSNGISIGEIGKHIVYVKVTDNCNNVTYINTDYIIINGYTESDLIIGRNASSYPDADAYITDKSTITLNINYSNDSSDLSGYTHNLISDILLPLGTKITLIDHITNKVYEYKISTDADIYNYNDSCNVNDSGCTKVATYPLTLFKEVGTGREDKSYTESSYYNNGIADENFSIILDLSGTNISTNYNNVKLYMELHDSNGNNVRPTLYSTIKQFSIYSSVSNEDTSASLNLTTDYDGDKIEYNSNSSTDIDITSGLNYKYINGNKIIDTTYEDKEIGLSIKLVDDNGATVDKDHLKNIIFKIGDNIYYPDDDGVVRIDLGSGIVDVTKTLTIITNENNDDLSEGTYYFKISNYVSYDGYYSSDFGDTELSIPVDVSDNNSSATYSFDVIMNDSNRIISKDSDTVKIPFSILQNGPFHNPNIRISLYKKDQLTAYNQDYSIVDLADYVSSNLNRYDDDVYYAFNNPSNGSYSNFELDLITKNFENTGYKFVFDLYDGDKKIGTIEKYFIVK